MENSQDQGGEIRKSCFVPAQFWQKPSGKEVREMLKLVGLSGSEASLFLGLGEAGPRTVRKWASGEAAIPYTVWAVLSAKAGFGNIWE